MNMVKLYLDDERPCPDGWVACRWPEEVFAWLETGRVSEISLDHDLGDDERGTGYDVVRYVEEALFLHGVRPPRLLVHSANSSARQKMQAGIDAIERQLRRMEASGDL